FQCTYVGPEGRCPERRGLEIDHRDPVARGGSNEPENLRVLCRAHNRLMAERAFGIGFMQTRIAGTSTAGEELRPELAERAEDRRLDSSEQAAKTGGRT
ncbi:MAG: HNH endonuclease, partial [Candidatus Eisenbacteria bacterium]|nr:HNH endonuclease [Candidatus Eisenbacteria bacterium]